MSVRTASAALLAMAAIVAGCSSNSTPENRVEVADNVTIFTPVQAEKAEVTADQVVLPLAGNEALTELAVDSVIVSDRAQTVGYLKNPTGFLRRVQEVRTEGQSIIIRTSPAALGDAIRHASVRTVVHPGLARLKPPEIKHKVLDDTSSSALVDTSWKISPPSTSIPIHVGGKTVTLKISESLTIKKAYLDFDPDFDMGLDIDWGSVKEFHAIAGGSFASALVLQSSTSVAWDKDLTEDAPADELTEAITEAVEKATKLKKSTPIVQGSIPLPTWFIGPVPVVSDLNVSVDLSCSFSAKGTVNVEVGAEASSSIRAGIQYLDGDWNAVGSQSFEGSIIGPDITVAGAATVECGLKPSFQLRFYDVAGPYIYLNAYESLGGEFKSACTGKAKPECTVSASLTPGISGGVGARIDIGVLGMSFREDLGEIQLFDWNNPQELFNKKLGSCDFGMCSEAEPSCGDGACNGEENCSSCPSDCSECDTQPCHGWKSGKFCGGTEQFPAGQAGVLYTCAEDVTAATQVCPYGCQSNPFPTNDACVDNPCAGYANGDYCGASSGFGGVYGTLYTCSGGEQVSSYVCSFGCVPDNYGGAQGCSDDPCLTHVDGSYCGDTGQMHQGRADTLYHCRNHAVYDSLVCGSGCHELPPGTPDECY